MVDRAAAATVAAVVEGRARFGVVQGDALEVLGLLPDGSVDLFDVDSPYASGGLHLAQKRAPTGTKYAKDSALPSFTGDARSQLAWIFWTRVWMAEALRAAVKPSGRLLAFVDDRQFGALQLAIEGADWRWMGAAVWNKGGAARVIPTGFRRQCEFVQWASAGPLPGPKKGLAALPGCFTIPAPRAKVRRHQTEKPVALHDELVKLCPVGGLVVDCFAGSGSAAVAALRRGCRVLLVERSPHYARVSQARCAETLRAIEDGTVELAHAA